MTTMSSRLFIALAATSVVALAACQPGEGASAGDGGAVAIETVDTIEAPADVVLAPLPETAEGLQNFMVAAYANGETDEFDRAVEAYVMTIEDRRRQRDFTNDLWSGANGVEKNQAMALPLAIRLSEVHDISAPTYLAGMAYWAPAAGVEQDFGQVIKYWSNPNQATNATVQYRLANIYLNQDAGYYDLARATELMQTAAAGGNAEAVSWLASN